MKTDYEGGFISVLVAPLSPRRKAVGAKTEQRSGMHTRLHCVYFGNQAVLIGARPLVVAAEVGGKKRMSSWQARDFVAILKI
jgi:hypothetical protein